MGKVLLQFEDMAFETECDFGFVFTFTKDGERGMTVRSVTSGSGSILDITHTLGQTLGGTLKKMAQDSGKDVTLVFSSFIAGMLGD